jgi:hypothetical protein
MFELATSYGLFAAVVIAVMVIGIVVSLIVLSRNRDPFADEAGGLWVFHGEADTSPHEMPGTRFEERHVIDPEPQSKSSPSQPR